MTKERIKKKQDMDLTLPSESTLKELRTRTSVNPSESTLKRTLGLTLRLT